MTRDERSKMNSFLRLLEHDFKRYRSMHGEKVDSFNIECIQFDRREWMIFAGLIQG